MFELILHNKLFFIQKHYSQLYLFLKTYTQIIPHVNQSAQTVHVIVLHFNILHYSTVQYSILHYMRDKWQMLATRCARRKCSTRTAYLQSVGYIYACANRARSQHVVGHSCKHTVRLQVVRCQNWWGSTISNIHMKN